MKLEMEHIFNWPADKVIEIHKAGEDIFKMDDLENVNARKKIYQKREGSRILSKNEWCVHGQIPKLAQRVINPEMLTFVEETVWDDQTASYTSKITPHFLKNAISCKSSSAWMSAGEGKTKRQVVINVEIKIMVVGPLMEKAILDHFRKNNNQSAGMVVKSLTERLGAPAAS